MRIAVLISLVLVGCAAPQPRTVPRVVDGQVESGPFVSPYAYHWFIVGEVEATKNAYESSAIAFEAARAAPSEDAFLLTRLAEAYERVNEPRHADRALADAWRLAPSSELVWLAKGRIHELRKEPDDAVRAYQQASEVAPSSAAPPMALARLLRSRGQGARAQAVLESYLRWSESSRADVHRVHLELALARGDLQAVTAMLEEPNNEATRSQARDAAWHAYANDRPGLAARLLEGTADNPADRRLLVRALVASGQNEKALAILRDISSEALGGVLQHAEIYLEAGNAKATQDLLKRSKDTPKRRFLIGAAYLAQRRYNEAAKAFASVPQGSRDRDRALKGLVACLQASGLNSAAREILEHAQ